MQSGITECRRVPIKLNPPGKLMPQGAKKPLYQSTVLISEFD